MKNNLYFGFIMGIIFRGCLGSGYFSSAPDKTGGKPLMQALNERQSIRTFTKDNLTQQQLSDLLWAGWGINRPDEKKRTAPSSRNVQEIDVYVTLPGGLYLYIAESNKLNRLTTKISGS